MTKKVKSKNVSLALSEADLLSMEDKSLILATIEQVKKNGHELRVFFKYFNECKRRFDNRGKPGRIIAGYHGLSDFVERGLKRNLRTLERQIAEFNNPTLAEERRKKDRDRDLFQKVNAQSDANIRTANLLIKGYQQSVRPYIESASHTQKVLYPYVEHVEQPQSVKLIPVTVETEPQVTRELRRGWERHPHRKPSSGFFWPSRNRK